MAAKTFWTRHLAESLVTQLLPAFTKGQAFDLSEQISQTIVCGDMRRDPEVTSVKHLCIVAVLKGSDPVMDELREMVKANVRAIWPGSVIRNFKLYDYVELPDGSGNVSWLITPEDQAGAATLHATGPVTFCKMLEMFAESQGLTFGASGVKRGEEKLVTPNEQSVFEVIGAGFVPMDLRESIRYIEPVNP